MEFVWLQGEGLKAIAPIVAEWGWTPLPSSAIAIAAIDDDGVAGFHVLQMRPHAEPLYVRPNMRGTVLASRLVARMDAFLKDTDTKGFIVIADNPTAIRFCESLDMRRLSSPTYVR